MESWQQQIEFISYSSIRIVSAVLIFFGVGLLMSSVSVLPWSKQVASTLGIDYTLSNTTSVDLSGSGSSSGSGGSVSSTTNIESSINFVSAVPDKVSTNFEVTVAPTAIADLKLTVNGLSLDKIILLQPISTQYQRVIFSVPVSQLPVGKYELKAFGYRLDGTKLYVTGPRFEVISATLNEVTTNVSGSGEGGSIASTTVISNPIITSTETSFEDDDIKDESQDIVSDDEIEKLTLIPGEVSLPAKIILPLQNSYHSFVPVQIITSVPVQEVSVYIQSPLVAKSRFIGSARYYNTGQWLLMVDTKQIPNGEYNIFAQSEINNTHMESKQLRFFVYNPPLVIESKTVESSVNDKLTSEDSESDVPVTRTESSSGSTIDIDDENSELVDNKVRLDSSPSESVVLAEDLKVLISSVLKELEKPINARLREYSEIVRLAAKIVPEESTKAEKAIMAILLNDSRLSSASAETELRLRREVVRLVKNAGEVELLLARREAEKQNNEDFIRGLSAATVVPEDSLVDVSSPREFGLVRDDLLKIESVSPIVAVDTVSTSTTIYTEIRGRALPNSLVTLYIYSSPVMVTVQTDADGTFVYIYEKDLSDGDHEVYVALTTTAGAVAAKSEGFQFVREAQAFNTPDTESGDILEPVNTTTPLTSNPYFIALSFSILVFGLVLLFLGLRAGKKSEENEENIEIQ